MHDLDNFILPIPRFEGDIPIPTIPISVRDLSAESFEDHPSDPVPTPKGLGPVSERHQSTQIPPKGPRRLSGNL
jgi:hypothetical protein